MRQLYLASLLTAAACGPIANRIEKIEAKWWAVDVPRVVLPIPAIGGDARMREFTTEFYADAEALNSRMEQDIVSLDIVADPLAQLAARDADLIGQCQTFYNPDGAEIYRAIVVARSSWETMTWQSQKTLIYHLLGHCALNETHAESNHLMSANLLNDAYAESNWVDLVENEFKDSKL